MCGFFAVAGAFSADEAARLASIGHGAQGHRGPDGVRDESFELVNGMRVLLGHQRLSIIDLSDGGSQPMTAQSGRSIVGFNGEIYNYLEMARDVPVCLKTRSDTEVLLEFADAFGLREALRRANGMWGLVYLTPGEAILEFARDRAGEKPLYYWSGGGRLIAASELKTVAALAGVRFSVNPMALADYMNQGVQDAREESWLDGVRALPAGSIGRVDWSTPSPTLVSEKIWSPSIFENAADFGAAQAELTELFRSSVEIRLRSDVPVAVTLSGGLDSSAIAAEMARQMGDPTRVHAISAVSPGQMGDESKHIDRAIEAIGVKSHRVDLSWDPRDSFDLMERVSWHNDAPLSSLSNIAFFRLMQKARELGIKVVLSGQGADEMFCGYRKYFFWSLRDDLRKGRVDRVCSNLAGSILSRTVVAQFSLNEARRYLPNKSSGSGMLVPASISHRVDRHALGLGRNSIAGRQLLDLTRYSVPYLTHYEDRASMANGVEVRLPFLDHRIMEFALRQPSNYKITNGWTKYLMRKSFAHLLPQDILWRRDKQGFSNPQEQWLRGELRTEVGDLLFGSNRSVDLGLIDQTALRSAWNRFHAGDRSVSHHAIFSAWALECWLRSFSPYLKA